MLMILSIWSRPSIRSWAPRAKPRPVQAVGDRAVEDLVDERRLARAGHPRDAAEDPQRHADVDVLEVVLARPAHHQLAARAAAKLRDRDGELAVQVLAGQGAGLAGHLGRRALGDQLPAVLAGPRAEVDDVVRGADRALVVLDHDHRVAEIAQPPQRVDQPRVVTLVEADRGLVEDVEDAHQRRADLRREPDPLGLAAREGRGGALQRQVADPDAVEEAQTLGDLAHHQPRDRPLGVGQLQRLDPLQGGPGA